jgi:hypothetical protein
MGNLRATTANFSLDVELYWLKLMPGRDGSKLWLKYLVVTKSLVEN